MPAQQDDNRPPHAAIGGPAAQSAGSSRGTSSTAGPQAGTGWDGGRGRGGNCSRDSSAGRGRGRGASTERGRDAAQRRPTRPQQQQQNQDRRWSQQQGHSSVGSIQQRKQYPRLGPVISKAASVEELLQLQQQYAGRMNEVAVATCYCRLGKLCQHDPLLAQSAKAQQVLQQLDQLLPSVQGHLGARSLSNVIWGCAYSRHVSAMKTLVPIFLQPSTLCRANNFDIANVAWAAADRGLQLNSQQLQSLLTAYTKQAGAAIPQGIATVLWGAALMQQQVPVEQLQLLVTALVQQAERAQPQNISNTLWAVAEMGHQLPQQQLRPLLAALVCKLDVVNTQDIANALYAAAKMGQQVAEGLLKPLLAAFISKLHTATLQHISNTMYAVAKMEKQVPIYQLEPMLAALERQLASADPQHISNSLLACVAFRYLPMQLLAAFEQQHHLERFLQGADPQELSNTLYAIGQLGYLSNAVLTPLVQQALLLLEQNSGAFVCQNLCNISWSIAVLDMQHHAHTVLQLVGYCNRLWGHDVFRCKDAQQLHQVHTWLANRIQHGGLSGVLNGQQLKECRTSWLTTRQDNAAKAASKLQQQVYDSLQQLPSSMWRARPAMEQVSSDGNFSIDIAAVKAAGVQLAIEVDGPMHFVSPRNRLNGPTQFRNRILTAQGYTVICIPYWEWSAYKTRQQRQQYLLDKLQDLSGHSPTAK